MSLVKYKKELTDLMHLHYGFKTFRRGQEEAIDAVLAGQDTVVIMPTGGGKSLCYQLPALVLDGLTIVISPLIALMKDQVDQLNNIGIAATFINSSLSDKDTANRLAAIQAGQYRLVYIAPERFYNQAFINALANIKIGLFAVDEAHCISQWGHDFRPSYGKLAAAIKLLNNPPVIALTATATPEVRADISQQLNLRSAKTIITGFARPNLQFGVIPASDSQKPSLILNTVQSLSEPTGIIYTATRAKTETILQTLIDAGIDAIGYHAGMDAAAREQAQNDFMSGRVPIIVATNAFGMGVDKKDIRFVIHDQMPGTVEAYYQEAGRAGRDGDSSLCLIFYHPRDRYLREFFIKGDNPDPNLILEIYEILTEMPTLTDSGGILITYSEIKSHLSEEVPEMAIGTALKILEAAGYIRRSRERQGQAYLSFLASPEKMLAVISPKSKTQRQLLTTLNQNYGPKLNQGWAVNLEDLAAMAGGKKSTLQALIKKLTEAGLAEYRPPFKGTEVFLLKRVPSEEVKIDFTALNAKARAAYAKLDKIEDYIYDRRCRQQFILDYFGESGHSPCGHCDLCLNGRGLERNFNKNSAKKYQSFAKPITDLDASDIKPAPFATKLTQLQTFDLYNQDLNPQQIADKRNLKINTVVEHLIYLIEKKLPIDINRLVDHTKQAAIKKVIVELGTDKLKPLKEALPEDVNYEEIKLVVAYYKKSK